MYNEFFGFERAPFNNTPDPTFLFESKSHREAMATMVYGVEQGKGFVMVTGDVGMGKTMLSQALKQSLGDDYVVIEIANPWSSPEEVLSAIRLCVNVQGPENNALFDGLRERLMTLRNQGKRVVIVIDEAHQMSERMIEGIRLLSNVETTTEKLLQIIFIGQNELAEMLSRHSMRQIQQRLFLSRHLEAFSESETVAYIRHRLKVAGGKPDVFDEAALRMIARESAGTPRVINQLCDNALLFAMGRGQSQVGVEDTLEALRMLRPWQPIRPVQKYASQPSNLGVSSKPDNAEVAAPTTTPAKPNSLPFNLPVGQQSTRGDNHSQSSRNSDLPFSLPIDSAQKLSSQAQHRELKVPEFLTKADKHRNFLIPSIAIVGVLAAAGATAWYLQQGDTAATKVAAPVVAAPVSPPPLQASSSPLPVAPVSAAANITAEPISLSMATSLSFARSESPVSDAPAIKPAAALPAPPTSAAMANQGTATVAGMPRIANTRIVTIPREGGVPRIAAETFGLWNESARDLIHLANPEFSASLEQVAGGTFLKMPTLTRESLIVDAGGSGARIYYGTFASPEEAQTELTGLQRIWPNSQIQHASRNGTALYRVFIGNFASRQEATAALESLWFKHLPALN